MSTIDELYARTPEIGKPVARQARQCLALALSFAAMMALAWLYVCVAGCSMALVQTLGTGYVLAIGLSVVISIFRAPATIVRPVNVFLVTSVYLLVLDTATLRYVESFSPELLLTADTLIGVYFVAVLGACQIWRARTSFLTRLFRGADRNLTGSTYFWIVVLVFSLEYLGRFYSVGFSVHELLDVMLSAKNIKDPHVGFAFRRGAAGGWDVFFLPIDSMFLGLTAFVDRAWKRGISQPQKVTLLFLTVLQLVTIALTGDKGVLLIAISLPLVIRAAQHDESSGRWIMALVLASFLMAPLMDTMQQVRGSGWVAISEVHDVSWNLVEAPRDDNLRWTVSFIAYLKNGPGVLAYMGPLGFIAGLRSVGWQWLITPIPRVFWPGKPEPWKRLEPGRPWNASESGVGDLLRYGGVSFVLVGGLLMGLWLSLLEPLYLMPKGDGVAMIYGYLQLVTAGLVRTTSAGAAIPPLLTCVLVLFVWTLFSSFAPSVRSPAICQSEKAYIE